MSLSQSHVKRTFLETPDKSIFSAIITKIAGRVPNEIHGWDLYLFTTDKEKNSQIIN